MPEWLYLSSAMPVEIVATYAYTKILDMNRKWLFWLFRMGLCLILVFVREDLPPWMRITCALVLYMMLPFFCSKGSLPRRALISALSAVALSVAEIVGVVPWMVLTGSTIGTYDLANGYAVEFFLMRFFHILLVATLYFAIYSLFGKKSAQDEGDNRGLLLFTAFPVTQLLLISVGLAINQYILFWSQLFYWALLVLCCICIAMDFALFIILGRYNAALREEQRAQLLQEQLDDYLQKYELLAASVVQVSKARHDLRNHLQVISALAERGEFDEARNYLTEARRGIEGDCGGAHGVMLENEGVCPSSMSVQVGLGAIQRARRKA